MAAKKRPKKRKLLPAALRVRRTWPIPPVTKVKASAKKYSRKKLPKPGLES